MRKSALLPKTASVVAASDPDRWGPAGVEPTVDELLADPMTALVMRRDRIGPEDVMRAVEHARAAMAEKAPRHAPPMPFMRPQGHWTPSTVRPNLGVRLPLATAV